MIAVSRGNDPHISARAKATRTDGNLSRDDFAYDETHDIYVSPGGKTRRHGGGKRLYRWNKHDCVRCPDRSSKIRRPVTQKIGGRFHTG
jgi:hypothetical protein